MAAFIDYVFYRPIMYDVVLDELTCYETMNNPAQLQFFIACILVSHFATNSEIALVFGRLCFVHLDLQVE